MVLKHYVVCRLVGGCVINHSSVSSGCLERWGVALILFIVLQPMMIYVVWWTSPLTVWDSDSYGGSMMVLKHYVVCRLVGGCVINHSSVSSGCLERWGVALILFIVLQPMMIYVVWWTSPLTVVTPIAMVVQWWYSSIMLCCLVGGCVINHSSVKVVWRGEVLRWYYS
jgi:hypothetical protein